MDWIMLFAAALAAGAINALAGGGSFITLPALLFHGLPATAANATSATAVLPGYVTTLTRLRREVEAPAGLNLPTMIAIAAAGGVSGAALLLATGDRAFAAIVPWLMAVATLIFAAGPWIKRATRGRRAPRSIAIPALYLTCAYGGYFNGGVGIIMIAVLGLLGQTRLLSSVAMKAVTSAVLTTISVLVYAAFGLVHWPLAALMAGGALIGGWLGAATGHAIDPRWHRIGIVVIGVVMTALMFGRGA
ncbi:sulfite exporter TauE/SafE family protein [Salinisphaera hydrothermalis]|uniref:sulfite exporter TauE/SafE family protein n=1 Tax=Salinisphaera hydrothermalis TaxID=563188 RepID=UPI003340765A